MYPESYLWRVVKSGKTIMIMIMIVWFNYYCGTSLNKVWKNLVFNIYVLRFSHQILLHEKAFQILLWPIRETKRYLHEWKNPFASLIGRSKIRNAFSHSKIWCENLSMFKISKLKHGKCFLQDFRTRWWSIRNLTRSLHSLLGFQILQQLMWKSRTRTLSMK